VSEGWRAPLVVETRDEQPDDPFASILRAAGAQVMAMPTIGHVPPEDACGLVEAIERLPSVRWVVFTSAQAVTATCGHPRWASAWEALAAPCPRIAAVGPATAERLRAFGLDCDLVPDRSSGGDLAAALLAREGNLTGVSVLWPRSDIASRELSRALAAAGALVIEPDAYRTIPIVPATLDAFAEKLAAGRVDVVAFFSPSAAQGLARALGDGSLGRLAGPTEVASIGPSTSAALAGLGAPATVEAEPRTGAGLARAILQRLAVRRGAA
jgi:uroporphyrinogen III methyltransferase / synthase